MLVDSDPLNDHRLAVVGPASCRSSISTGKMPALLCILTSFIFGGLSQTQMASAAAPSPPKQQNNLETPAAPAKSESPTVEELTGYKTPAEYLIISSKHYPSAVVAVTLPVGYDRKSKKSYPLVVAFGGMGECIKPPRQGSLAWLHYYKTDEAIFALQNNRLEAQDLRGLATQEQLAAFNTRLKSQPYGGIILACPSSPVLTPHARLEIPEYETFIMEDLIPALTKRYRVKTDKIGVDGVSMGGARSMYYGFKYPGVFASIGSVQGAFGPYLPIYRELVKKNKDLIGKRPIQVVTSDKDTMGPSVEKMHQLLAGEGIKHTYLKLTGPHDYIFNQGPGAVALLLFHNQVLASTARGPVR